MAPRTGKTGWLLSRLLALLILLAVGVYVLQDRYLYFPDVVTPDEFAATHPGLAPWPTRDAVRGLLRAPAAAPRATVIVFHGNAGHAGHRGWYADQLSGLGLRVILAEYPGYGPRPGKPGETVLIDDAARTIALARKAYGGPLLVIGESLGAAVAAGAVARDPAAVEGLLLITPWDRLENVARHHYGPLLQGWMLHDRYDSAAALTVWPGPTLVAVAGNDSIVPARFGRALFERLQSRKRYFEFAGADHNDWMDSADDTWWASTLRFLLGEEH